MHSPAGRLVRVLALGAFLALSQPAVIAAATPTHVSSASQVVLADQTPPPDSTLTVVPSLVSLDVKPGGTGSTDLTLRAGIAETVKVQVQGLGQASDGSFEYVGPAQDTSAYSARSMVSFSPDSFQMQPGASQQVTVTVTVPADAGEGTRYALLRITATPGTGDQNVGLGVELGVPALIALGDSKGTRKGSIQQLAADATSGDSLVVSGTLENTGNTHYGAPPNEVTTVAVLYDSSGKKLATGRLVSTGNSIVPTFGRDFSITMPNSKSLSAGHYRVEVSATLTDGTVLDKKALAFDVSDGTVAGATFVPVQSAPATSSGGGDAAVVVLAVVGGVLAGALIVAFVVLGTRRRTGTA